MSLVQQHALNHSSLTLTCEYDANGLLAAKTETQGQSAIRFEYEFDADGRLEAAFRDGAEFERYYYNREGQRIFYACAYRTMSEIQTAGDLKYDGAGRLTVAGRTAYAYDERGALRERSNSQGVTRFFYNGDTALDSVILPSGDEIRYEYAPDSPINLVRRFKNGVLTGEYEWESPVRLGKFVNWEDNLVCEFFYADEDEGGALAKIRLSRPEVAAVPLRDLPPERLSARLAVGVLVSGFRPQEYLCGCDQVGTPKVLTGVYGKPIKVCDYSSFGVPVSDSFPQLFVPVGFAGGLLDRDTGLVRFGWRDYDPEVGRFTAPDPAKDLRGDGDLYDYCVDDPVSHVDPMGLKFSHAAAVAGGESHRGISHPFGAPHGTSMGNAGGGKNISGASGKNISGASGKSISGGGRKISQSAGAIRESFGGGTLVAAAGQAWSGTRESEWGQEARKFEEKSREPGMLAKQNMFATPFMGNVEAQLRLHDQASNPEKWNKYDAQHLAGVIARLEKLLKYSSDPYERRRLENIKQWYNSVNERYGGR